MTTEPLFRDDAYATSCEARVLALNGLGGIVLDRTVFFPTGGGQPGDTGTLTLADSTKIAIVTAVKGGDENSGPDVIVHVPAEGQALPEPGAIVSAEIDWTQRHRHMRIHSCLHLLSSVLSYPVTGGQVGDGTGRLDFDIPGANQDKTAITAALNALIAQDHPVTSEWIDKTELEARPELVKTMSVAPPRGAGRIRLIRIGELDLQPCGGTHVARTSEIGSVTVTKIQSKGRQNRRVAIALDD
jgi:misacylated tRNA(Ala) deacylase